MPHVPMLPAPSFPVISNVVLFDHANIGLAYGMAVDLGGFLAVYGALYDGNALSLTPGYSIGGPAASEAILSGFGLLGTPPGLSGSHNNYEADSSPTRGDLYVTYSSPHSSSSRRTG